MILVDILYLILEIVFGAGCFVLAIIADKYLNSKFKMVYLIPAAGAIFHIAVSGFDKIFIASYVALGLLIIGFFIEKKILRQILSIAVVVVMIAEFAICDKSPAYREPDYVAEFEYAIDILKEHYVLAEYKGVDLDELHDKYLPMIEDAKKRHDKIDCYIAWLRFSNEFNDGHVGFFTELTGEEYEETYARMYGNDYGFSLIRKSDGQIAAVNVEPGSEAEAAGIKNGSIIVEWNGQPIENMIADFDAPLERNYPVKETKEFLRVIYAAGQSGDTLTVTFVNEAENGNNDGGESNAETDNKIEAGSNAETNSKKEVTLNKIGIYKDRLDNTVGKLIDGTLETNLTVRQLNETTAFMRIDGMAYDTKSYGTSDYSKMDEQLRLALQVQKDAGVTNMIIDLRANTGGDPSFDRTVLKFFFPEGEYVMSYNSVWDYDNNCYMIDEATGNYMLGAPNTLVGENFWGDGQIIVLVSADTVSAGDMFTEVISRLDNVTIMGITPSNCACQAVRAADNMKFGALSFSAVPDLNADGTIYIDTDASGEATIPLDVQVEVDDAFIDAVFNNGTDYVVDMALEMISNN